MSHLSAYTGIYIFLIAQCLAVQHEVVSDAGIIVGTVETVTFNNTVKSVRTYLGVPYAEAPTKQRRFRKPVRKAAFTEKFYATKEGNVCPQVKSEVYLPRNNLTFSEDCLLLNIYAPGENVNASDTKAVMIWIHGGFDADRFETGASNFYIGDVISGYGDIVVVTINYRVGLLGFFTTYDKMASVWDSEEHVLGNFGLWDQHLAIQWVHDNIASFGGDPNRVTIAGQGTGSVCALYQALYPGNKGLFQRVIAQSGTPVSTGKINMGPYINKVDTLMQTYNLGCISSDMGCMRNLSVDSMMILSFIAKKEWYYTPVIDGDFIRADPQVMLDKGNEAYEDVQEFFTSLDLLLGVNSMNGWIKLATQFNFHPDMLNSTGTRIQEVFHQFGFKDAVKKAIESLYGQVYYMNYKKADQLLKLVENRYTDLTAPTDRLNRLRLFLQFLSDYEFRAPTLKTALLHVSLPDKIDKVHTYLYELKAKPTAHVTNFRPKSWIQDASDMDDVLFVFGFSRRLLDANAVSAQYKPSDEELKLSESMMTIWSNFVKDRDTGNSYLARYYSEASSYVTLKYDNFTYSESFGEPGASFWLEELPILIQTLNQSETVTSSPHDGATYTIFKMTPETTDKLLLVFIIAALCLLGIVLVLGIYLCKAKGGTPTYSQGYDMAVKQEC